ncbi:HNH endonuclease, partial [Mycolicibacterium moriokaense]
TSPTGHTYTTHPGSKHLFPRLCEPTATLWTGEPPVVDTTSDRGVMMPKRPHTRAANTAKAKAAERQLNDDHVAERNKPPPF